MTRRRKSPVVKKSKKKILQTPLKGSSGVVIVSKNEVNRILKEIHQATPTKKDPSTPPNKISSEKKRRKNQIENLVSDLSPKYVGFSQDDGKRSRYGRQQRCKEPEDFLPTNIACYVRRTPSKLKAVTSPGSEFEQKFISYESPIEKLIQKNKILANIVVPASTPTNIDDDDDDNDETDIKVTSEDPLAENITTNESVTLNESELNKSSTTIQIEAVIEDQSKPNMTNLIEVEYSGVPAPNDTDREEKLTEKAITAEPVMSSLALKTLQIEPSKQETIISPEYETIQYDKTLKLNNNNDLMTRQMNKSPSINSTDSAKGSSIESDYMDLSIVVGDLLWGRISTFPYWPCIIWPDPQGRIFSVAGRNQIRIHVRFFADNGRRSWIRKTDLLPYKGKSDFEKQQKEFFSKYDKKHPNYRGFYVTESRESLWNRAISEADLINAEAIETRCEKFTSILEESRKQTQKLRLARRRSLHESRMTSKYYSGISEDTCSVFSEPFEFGLKRDRSPTTAAPTFDNEDMKMYAKRRKIDLNGSRISSKSKSIEDLLSLSSLEMENLCEDDEFHRFYDLLKSYVMTHNNEMVEKIVYQNVKNLWLVRDMMRKEAKDTSFNSISTIHEINIRRLSSRIRGFTQKDKAAAAASSSSSLNNEDLIQVVNTKQEPKKKHISKPVEEVVDDIMNLNKNYLFRGLSREPVCKICYKPTNLVKCSGLCQLRLHPGCAQLDPLELSQAAVHVTGDVEEENLQQLITAQKEKILCKECNSGAEQNCFVCKKNDPNLGERFKCHISWCGKAFHLGCLKYWPQAKLTKSSAKIESLLCPGHVCHTCVSDDPRGKFLQIDKLKLARCVECPATYHLDSFCIPAGTQFLSAISIICPRHRKNDEKKPHVNVNANWCFICATGGSLICCETCPTAFHLECLKIPQPEGNYICEECETGRLPLYGEMVWAKLGHYRWWPAIIIPPPEVPKNLMDKTHNESDFCVRFFGSNDHTWISRRRVFLYQEGDWGRVNQTKGIEKTYKNGLEEARRISEIIKTKKLLQKSDEKDKRLTPLPYIKIKTNRPVPPVKLQEFDISEQTACDCNPSDINPCGPNSGCLNRLLLTECNPKICPVGQNCQNQMFEKRSYPPLKVCRTNGKGWGLICEEPLLAGTFIIEYVGEVIDDAEFKRRIAQKQEEKDDNYYFLILEKDYMIDAGPKGNLARFMNHSCEPNCDTQKWNVNGVTRVGLFAIKDIPANTELTFNYNLECIGDDKKICHCGAEKCAGFIGAKYKEPVKEKPITTKGTSSIKNSTKLKTVTRKTKKLKGKPSSSEATNI